MYNVFLLLGSNKGDRFKNLNKSVNVINRNIGTLVKTSSIYETEPWGFSCENYFFNQVILIKTKFKPFKLLDKLQDIEKDFGRERAGKTYNSRILDIDILFYEDIILKSEYLNVPHQHIPSRKFTLYPLLEIAPDFLHPILKVPVKQLCENCNDRLHVRKMKFSYA